MGDDKNTEELEDVSGGPDTVAPPTTDALEDVDGGDVGPFPDSQNAEEPLEEADGGQHAPGDGFWIT